LWVPGVHFRAISRPGRTHRRRASPSSVRPQTKVRSPPCTHMRVSQRPSVCLLLVSLAQQQHLCARDGASISLIPNRSARLTLPLTRCSIGTLYHQLKHKLLAATYPIVRTLKLLRSNNLIVFAVDAFRGQHTRARERTEEQSRCRDRSDR
jgi:hypothetical protein